MHFPVSQCSSYDDSRLPSKRDMERIAWILLTKKAGRSIGFVTSKQFQEIEGEDAEIIPARALHAQQPSSPANKLQRQPDYSPTYLQVKTTVI
jgi:hypothetical protein